MLAEYLHLQQLFYSLKKEGGKNPKPSFTRKKQTLPNLVTRDVWQVLITMARYDVSLDFQVFYKEENLSRANDSTGNKNKGKFAEMPLGGERVGSWTAQSFDFSDKSDSALVLWLKVMSGQFLCFLHIDCPPDMCQITDFQISSRMYQNPGYLCLIKISLKHKILNVINKVLLIFMQLLSFVLPNVLLKRHIFNYFFKGPIPQATNLIPSSNIFLCSNPPSFPVLDSASFFPILTWGHQSTFP